MAAHFIGLTTEKVWCPPFANLILTVHPKNSVYLTVILTILFAVPLSVIYSASGLYCLKPNNDKFLYLVVVTDPTKVGKAL